MEPGTIARRLDAKRLIRVRRGIYRVGPIAQPLEDEMAAFLSLGPRAVLSHETAAVLHQLLPYATKRKPVHLTVTGSDPGPKPGIRIHRTRHLPADEITRHQRIPITTPARTIIDVAPGLTEAALEQVLAVAHRKRAAITTQLRCLITRYPRRPGTPALKALLDGPRTPKLARSRPERRLLEAFRRAQLPEPETNAPLAGFEVDFLWSEQQLVIEVDGHPFHAARPDRRRDQDRDARLAELGYSVLRLDADIGEERAVALVAAALARVTR
jgi:very-short-patch-repair endonuclease